MNDTDNNTANFSEEESFRVIQDMIQVSRKRHAQDGILFIVWGWALLIVTFVFSYIPQFTVTTSSMRSVFAVLNGIVWISALLFTIIYLIRRYRKVRTYTGITLLFVWIGLIAFTAVNTLIHMNFLHELMKIVPPPVEFPTMGQSGMTLVAYAIFITGLILRHKLVIIGGLIVGCFVIVSSYVDFQWELILESVGWIIAFIVPGHIIYAKRNRHA